MARVSIMALALTAALCSAAAAVEPTAHPIVTIGNGALAMEVMLPDSQTGAYRSTRFDWSGMVAQIRVGERTFLGIYRGAFQPNRPEGGFGLAEEFGHEDPPGYAEAKPGETFLKIGVGELERVDDTGYRCTGAIPFATAARGR